MTCVRNKIIKKIFQTKETKKLIAKLHASFQIYWGHEKAYLLPNQCSLLSFEILEKIELAFTIYSIENLFYIKDESDMFYDA